VKRHLRWGGTIGAIVVLASLLGLLQRLELGALNGLFDLRGPRAPASPIIIVTIDEDSFDELNIQWPFPRSLHGELLDILSQGKPAAIGMDIVFIEPSALGPQEDTALAGAIKRAGNVILAAAYTKTVGDGIVKENFNQPLPEIRAGAVGFGPVNHLVDPDGYVRRTRLELSLDDYRLQTFDWHLYQMAVKAGIPSKPLPKRDMFMINFRGGPASFASVPYYKVLRGEIKPHAFKDAIVLVGATSPVLHDVFSTPYANSNNMPGVEIHANVLETLFRGNRLRTVPSWTVDLPIPFAAQINRVVTVRSRIPLTFSLEILVVLALAVAAVWLTTVLRPLRAFFVLVGAGLVMGALALLAFTIWYVWLEVVAATLAGVLGYGVTVVREYIQEQREKRRLSRFFSPSVRDHIVKHQEENALGVSRRPLTVLFSDIRGFTSLSEKLPAEQVVELLSDYLTELTDIVFKYGGTVDKYVGDCIMALYNAPLDQPDHALAAVRTAVAFQKATHEISDRWEAKTGLPVKNGVGVHTGEAVVGEMGSKGRSEYTAIGDTVNLAARLESITKDFKSPIVISEATYQLVKGEFSARALGEVTVKGREEPVRIYAVLAEDTRKDDRAHAALDVTVVDGEVTVQAVTRDVSVSGIAIQQLPRVLSPGRMVQLRLAGNDLRQSIIADARVVWSLEGSAGLNFVDLGPDAAAALTDYVAERADTQTAGARSLPVPPVAHR
jgi:adenylate cyclase